MSRLNFLSMYAEDGRHYDQREEMTKLRPHQLTSMNAYHVKPENVDMYLKNGPFHTDRHYLDYDQINTKLSVLKDQGKLKSEHVSFMIDAAKTDTDLYHLVPHAMNADHIDRILGKTSNGDQPFAKYNQVVSRTFASPHISSDRIHQAIRTAGNTYGSAAVRHENASSEDIQWASNFDNHGWSNMAMNAKKAITQRKALDDMSSEYEKELKQ